MNKRIIKSNDEASGNASFNTVTYEGNGGTNPITDVGFQPDLVWIKNRDAAVNHKLLDSIRTDGGLIAVLESNTTGAEAGTTQFSSFDINGFTLDGSASVYNASLVNYVAWCWKAGGAAVTNTDGTITSQVSANVDAGFSIVSYTGSGVDSDVGHGLEATPKMIIVKNREEAAGWLIWFDGFSSSQYLQFNTDAIGSFSNFWGGTHSDTIFNNGSGNYVTVNKPENEYIAYCFAEVAGFSKFGSYEGNGTLTGPTITTDFEPAFVMIKSSIGAGNWFIWDNKRSTTNPRNKVLFPNSDSNENVGSTWSEIDFNSTGFQIKPSATSAVTNALNEIYIYMAFANQF